jgi:hypothetical protein
MPRLYAAGRFNFVDKAIKIAAHNPSRRSRSLFEMARKAALDEDIVCYLPGAWPGER